MDRNKIAKELVKLAKSLVSEKKKPTVKLTGTDGNVFALAGKVSQALKKVGQVAEAKELTSKLFKCKSYDEALVLMQDYVDVK